MGTGGRCCSTYQIEIEGKWASVYIRRCGTDVDCGKETHKSGQKSVCYRALVVEVTLVYCLRTTAGQRGKSVPTTQWILVEYAVLK